MSGRDLTTLVDRLGYLSGAALYAMLLVMVLQKGRRRPGRVDVLLLATALLGLVWNVAGMLGDGFHEHRMFAASAPLRVAAFAALGFLPAVVIHTALRGAEPMGSRPVARAITSIAYALSTVAAMLQVRTAVANGFTPAPAASRILAFGFGAVLAGLLIHTGRPVRGRQALWVVALAVFAMTALHWGHHAGGESWPTVLLGHHASLPLIVAILYQDYRFALADSFLKRALSLVLLVVVGVGMYVAFGAASSAVWGEGGRSDVAAMVATLGLGLGTALVYPHIRRISAWFVDGVILRRVDYAALRRHVTQRLGTHEFPEAILDEVSALLAPALSARDVGWQVQGLPLHDRATNCDAVDAARRSPRSAWSSMARATAVIPIVTTDAPHYLLMVGELIHGRRLLSDDLAMLDAVALATARRIDAVRVAHERCQRAAREQELQALAVQAELRELRAQLDPHFLFNALTTVAFLVQSAPDKGLAALIQLTTLLRAVLHRTADEFVTLGEEIDLVESYLAIECARFEERLRVAIDAPVALRDVRLPPLIIQPLVENAIKHGIARRREGGEVVVRARMTDGCDLQILVRDTGAGAARDDIVRGRDAGLGLGNISRRLAVHYGSRARLDIVSQPGRGTTVEVRLPAGADRAVEVGA